MDSIEIADAYVAIHAKMPGVEKDVAKGLGLADGEFEKAGKRGGGLFGSMVGANLIANLGADAIKGAVSGITDYMRESVATYKEAEQAQVQLSDAYSRFPAITDVSLDSLRDLNSELMNKTRFDDDALASGQALLAQYGLTGSQLQQLTPLVADFAAKTGTDVTTASGQVGKALLGQGRALKSVGIDFQDAGSVAANFDQIMGGLSAQVGGFAEKDGASAEGMAERMTNAFGELQETIGGALVPVITMLQGAFLTYVIPVLSTVVEYLANGLGPAIDTAVMWFSALGAAFSGEGITSDGITGIFEQIGVYAAMIVDSGLLQYMSPLGLAFQLLQPILPVILAALQQLAGVFGSVLAAVLPIVAQLITQIATVMSSVLAAVLPVLIPLIVTIATLFGQLASAVLPLLIPIIDLLATVLIQVLAAVMPIVSAVADALVPILSALIDVVVAVLGAILPLISTLIGVLAPVLTTVAQVVLAILVPALDVITSVVKFVAGVIEWAIGTVIVPYFTNILIPAIQMAASFFVTAFGGLGSFFGGLWSGIVAGFKGFINFIIGGINGFLSSLNGVGGFLSDITGGAVSFSVPSIPRLAEGAIVSARPGGIMANIGEGRYDEAVLPLSPSVLGALAGGGGGGGGKTLKQYIYPQQTDPRLQARQWGREAERAFASA